VQALELLQTAGALAHEAELPAREAAVADAARWFEPGTALGPASTLLYVAAADPLAPGLLATVRAFLEERERAEGRAVDFLWVPGVCGDADDPAGRLSALLAATHFLLVPALAEQAPAVDGEVAAGPVVLQTDVAAVLASAWGRLEVAAAALGGMPCFCLFQRGEARAFLPLDFENEGAKAVAVAAAEAAMLEAAEGGTVKGAAAPFKPGLSLMVDGMLALWSQQALAKEAGEEASPELLASVELWGKLMNGDYSKDDLKAVPTLEKSLARVGAADGGDQEAFAVHQVKRALLMVYLNLFADPDPMGAKAQQDRAAKLLALQSNIDVEEEQEETKTEGPPKPAVPSGAAILLSTGAAILADFQGMGKRRGVVEKVRDDGTYDVLFDHGAKEVKVSAGKLSPVVEDNAEETKEETEAPKDDAETKEEEGPSILGSLKTFFTTKKARASEEAPKKAPKADDAETKAGDEATKEEDQPAMEQPPKPVEEEEEKEPPVPEENAEKEPKVEGDVPAAAEAEVVEERKEGDENEKAKKGEEDTQEEGKEQPAETDVVEEKKEGNEQEQAKGEENMQEEGKEQPAEPEVVEEKKEGDNKKKQAKAEDTQEEVKEQPAEPEVAEDKKQGEKKQEEAAKSGSGDKKAEGASTPPKKADKPATTPQPNTASPAAASRPAEAPVANSKKGCNCVVM